MYAKTSLSRSYISIISTSVRGKLCQISSVTNGINGWRNSARFCRRASPHPRSKPTKTKRGVCGDGEWCNLNLTLFKNRRRGHSNTGRGPVSGPRLFFSIVIVINNWFVCGSCGERVYCAYYEGNIWNHPWYCWNDDYVFFGVLGVVFRSLFTQYCLIYRFCFFCCITNTNTRYASHTSKNTQWSTGCLYDCMCCRK